MCGSTMGTIEKHCEDRLEIFENLEFELEKLLDLKGMRNEAERIDESSSEPYRKTYLN